MAYLQLIRKNDVAVILFFGLCFIFQIFGALLFLFTPSEVGAAPSCAANADVEFVIDNSKTMGDGLAQNKCEWVELRDVNAVYSWFKNTKYNVSESDCQGTTFPATFDETIEVS
ncbi:MAG: hypothetical protein WBC48_00095, partial [Minisyncoccales bacterium]